MSSDYTLARDLKELVLQALDLEGMTPNVVGSFIRHEVSAPTKTTLDEVLQTLTICANCRKPPQEHAHGKCLFDAGFYTTPLTPMFDAMLEAAVAKRKAAER